jgi:hypothetical protein
LKAPYNYEGIKQAYGTPEGSSIITRAQAFKISDSVKANESIFFGGINITVERVRAIS